MSCNNKKKLKPLVLFCSFAVPVGNNKKKLKPELVQPFFHPHDSNNKKKLKQIVSLP